MNKYQYINNELATLHDDRDEELWALRLLQRYEAECFVLAALYGDVVDKDVVIAVHHEHIVDLPADFDPRCWTIAAEYSTKALHRKHRKGCRIDKDKHRKDSRWQYYYDGTAKECKTKNHKAVRREYDIPIGKSNFYHKVSSYEYFW